MKRPILIATLLLAMLAAAYITSYRTSYLPLNPGSNRPQQIVIAGIPIPYNSTTKRVFSFFYRPLIDHTVAAQPTREIEGMISRIDFSESKLVISFMEEKPDGTGGVIIGIPDEMKTSLTRFSRGDHVRATYGSRTTEKSPFAWDYELRSIEGLSFK